MQNNQQRRFHTVSVNRSLFERRREVTRDTGKIPIWALFNDLIRYQINLTRIESDLKTVVLGALHILAEVSDQIHLRIAASLKD